MKHFQVIEFQHSVEVHPMCDKDVENSQETLSFEKARQIAHETLDRKLTTLNQHYSNWQDPQDLAVIEKLNESKQWLDDYEKDDYLDFVFFGT